MLSSFIGSQKLRDICLRALASWVSKFISAFWLLGCLLQFLLSCSDGEIDLPALISSSQGPRKLLAVSLHARLWDETQPRELGLREVSLPYGFSAINSSPEVPYDIFHLGFFSLRGTWP
jgi:hypothetical protein